MHEISRFSTTVLQAIYIYNKFIYFISILLARIIVVLNLPILCTEILNTTNSISLISYWSSIIFVHEISRFSTTVLQAIYIYNKFIYFISILLARIIVVLNLPILCTEILNTTNSISLISYWSSIIFVHEISRFSTTVLQAIYIYNKFIYFISILLARIIVVLNLPILCTEILNTTNSISLISYWSSIIFVHEISRFSTTVLQAIYIYNKFIYFISILLARIIVVLNLPILCTEILNTTNSISLISYWCSIIFVHKISRFSTTVLQAIYIYNKFIYFISILLARIIVVLNLPISCTEIEFVIFSISLIS